MASVRYSSGPFFSFEKIESFAMQNIGKSTQTYTKRRTHLGRPCLPRWLHFCVCRAKRTDTTATTKQWWMKVSSSNYPPNFRTKIWNKKLVRIRNEKFNSVGANIPVTHSKENLLHRLSNGRALLNILCALYREFISAAIKAELRYTRRWNDNCFSWFRRYNSIDTVVV